MSNKLIVFEGIDGVGKSTLARSLKRELQAIGKKVVMYEEIEKKFSGYNRLRPFIKKEVAPLSVNASFYFYLSSAFYKSAIIQHLLKKYWVICDRYVYSTIADHKVRGVNKNLIPKLSSFPIRLPDFAFWIIVPDRLRLARIKKRKIINKQDLVPMRRGSRSYQMEQTFSRMGLIKIVNDTPLPETLKKILKKCFCR